VILGGLSGHRLRGRFIKTARTIRKLTLAFNPQFADSRSRLIAS
jgi:hypothetical protein